MSTTNEIVTAQHAIIGNFSGCPQAQYERTEHPDAQWLPRALGLFIHWGISSVRGTGDLSWSMMLTPPRARADTLRRHGPQAIQTQSRPGDYWKQAENFRPDCFEPREWLAAAKKAGFEYAVFTTKHHDGYTLWPSKVSGFGVQQYLPGSDFVSTYVEACRECGLKVGLYYSPPDWWLEKDRMAFGETIGPDGKMVSVDVDHQPIDLADLPSVDDPEYKKLWNAQVKGHLYELLQGYGKIDLLWFDGSSRDAVSLEELRALQPGILFNPRGLGYGDFDTAECAFPRERFPGWWEYCHIWNDGAWGYLGHEMYKPLGWMLGEWAKARSWGGAFLPNIGLNSRGEIPQVALRRFEELAKWRTQFGYTLSKHLDPGPWPERCNAPVIVNGRQWFVHLGFDWDELEIVLKEVEDPQRVLWLTAEPPRELPWRRDADCIRISIAKNSRGVLSDIVSIVFPEADEPA